MSRGDGAADIGLERTIARLLTVGTYVAIGLVFVGVVLMALTGVDPLTAEPVPFDPARLAADLVALRATGFLWSGIILLVALPIGRVGLEGIGYLRARDTVMVAVALGILAIVALSVLIALVVEI